MSSLTRRIVTFPAPQQVEVAQEPLRTPEPGEVQVRTTMSAISPGTERLIYRGDVPSESVADPSIDALTGGLAFPLTYGYAVVGDVEAVGQDVDATWKGQRVFSFQPHVSHFVAPTEAVVPVPDGVRNEDAVLIPNLETAVNFLMDGRPMIGERVVVFGQGVVGLLTTVLASRHPLACLLTVEPLPERRSQSKSWGADRSYDPTSGLDALRDALNVTTAEPEEVGDAGYEGADLVYELSGTPSVLNDAVSVTGYSGRIVVGSWYGSKTASVDLGGRFHRSRIQLLSSQVSSVDPRLRGRWTKDRRMDTVLDLLSQIRPGDLVTDVFSQQEAEDAYEKLDRDDGETILQPVFRYR